jgi:transcriptional regulator with XRE-family HTH domain
LGNDDARLAAVLGISRSTVWRLKNGKIHKLDRYIEALDQHFGAAQVQSLEGVLDDLRLWSKDSPELRRVLISLHKIVQESA